MQLSNIELKFLNANVTATAVSEKVIPTEEVGRAGEDSITPRTVGNEIVVLSCCKYNKKIQHYWHFNSNYCVKMMRI